MLERERREFDEAVARDIEERAMNPNLVKREIDEKNKRIKKMEKENILVKKKLALMEAVEKADNMKKDKADNMKKDKADSVNKNKADSVSKNKADNMNKGNKGMIFGWNAFILVGILFF